MAKPTTDTDSTIEGLLHQRAQYEQWLARLDSAGDKAPPAVRAKVRGDYEARLRGVIDQLRGHAATIAEELDRHKGTQAGLDHDRRHVEEELAEAEVRHTVGEYTEDEWRRISDQSSEQLSRLRGELRAVGDEIARLAEVQGLIAAAPKPAPPAPPPTPAPTPPPVAVVAEPEPPPVVEEPPPPVAKAPPKPPATGARGGPRDAPRRRARVHQIRSHRGRAEAGTASAEPIVTQSKQSGGGRVGTVGRCRVHRGIGDRTRQARRGRSGQDAQVRGMRDAQPPDGVVLRAVRGGARRHLNLPAQVIAARWLG